MKSYSKGQRIHYDVPVHFIRKLHGISGSERLLLENALPLFSNEAPHTQTERLVIHFIALISSSGRIFHDATCAYFI
jgi:hypothetical protein